MKIYIFTDSMSEAIRICDKLNIPFNQGVVRGNQKELVVWINEYYLIQGKIIFKEDILIWGRFHNVELFDRLICEVKMRQI